MQVINADRGSMPEGERRAVAWLRADTGPGIAISGVQLGDTGARGREADLVLFLPTGPVVIEAKKLLDGAPAAPVLRTSANRPWAVDGMRGDPVHVGPGDNSPFDQASGRMFDLKNALGGGVFVSAAVLVMAAPGTTLVVEHRGPLPFGVAIIAGNAPADLFGWLRGLSGARGDVWSAERVSRSLDALGVAVPPLAELVAAGFATDGTDPAAPTPHQSAGTRPRHRGIGALTGARRWPRTPRPRTPRPVHAPRARPRVGTGVTIRRGAVSAVNGLALALLVAGAAVAVLVVSVIATNAAGFSPTTPRTDPPTTLRTPSPPTTIPACRYPFQPGC